MSFSGSDFVECAGMNATAYDLPQLPAGRLAMLNIDPEDLADDVDASDAKLRALAERVACAMSDYQSFRKALEEIAVRKDAAGIAASMALDASAFKPAPGEAP